MGNTYGKCIYGDIHRNNGIQFYNLYPVQDGNDVSDNVRIKNNKLMLSGIITETPLALRGDMLSSAGVNGNRCSQAIAYLDEIMNARQPIIVSTEHKTFNNMILTGIDYEYKTESALQFDLQFG